MRPRKLVTIPVAVLRDYMVRILRAAGCDADNADKAAEVFLEADMRGIGFQGLDHMQTMLGDIRHGRIDPVAKPQIVRDEAAFALIDGHRGPGQPAALLAVETAAAKAKASGVCCVGITNSSDIFMIGYYADRLARAGLVGFAFTGAPPSVHPHGGRERILGTNPFAIAFPTDGDDPVVIDMATSAVSNSFVRQAFYYGEELPENVAFDAEGRPTASPASVRAGGSIAPLAGHKGFALALAVGLLAGPLVGSQVGKALSGWRSSEAGVQGRYGHFLIAINPASFGGEAVFREAVSGYLDEIRSSEKAAGAPDIRIPGERALSRRAQSLKDGVRMYDAIWDNFATIAQELGVAVPQVDRD